MEFLKIKRKFSENIQKTVVFFELLRREDVLDEICTKALFQAQENQGTL